MTLHSGFLLAVLGSLYGMLGIKPSMQGKCSPCYKITQFFHLYNSHNYYHLLSSENNVLKNENVKKNEKMATHEPY